MRNSCACVSSRRHALLTLLVLLTLLASLAHLVPLPGGRAATPRRAAPVWPSARVPQPAALPQSAPASRTAPAPDRRRLASLVSVLTHGSVRLTATFAGPDANIVGVIGRDRTGKKLMAWVLDGRYLATGSLFASDGRNLTVAAARSHGLVATRPSMIELARAAMAARGFTLGHGGPLLVAFEDPNCIYCQDARNSRRHSPGSRLTLSRARSAARAA